MVAQVALTRESRYSMANDIIAKFGNATQRKILILLNHFDKFFKFDERLRWWSYNEDIEKLFINGYRIFRTDRSQLEWNCECTNFIYNYDICSHIATVQIYNLFLSDMREIRNYVNYYRIKTTMKKRIMREMRHARRLEPKVVTRS